MYQQKDFIDIRIALSPIKQPHKQQWNTDVLWQTWNYLGSANHALPHLNIHVVKALIGQLTAR